MSELVFRRKNDWDELLDFADNLLVCLIRSLQDSEKYAAHLRATKRLYPSALDFKLGLNEDGKLLIDISRSEGYSARQSWPPVQRT